jgi:CheY-like chemotaxis protein
LRVLLVEDNDINRLYASSILKTWGCSVESAENGFVAVEKVRNEHFDIVLMDIQMPVMDGFEATKNIRAFTKPKSNIPIIALTANATRRDVEKCLAEGMDDCIAKPFTPEDLYYTLNKHYRKGRAAMKSPAPSNKITFDLSYLRSISNNNEEFIKEMITTFIQTLPLTIDEIQSSAKASNWETVGRAVHKIKPSITLIGLGDAKSLAVEIETLAKTNQPTERLFQLVDEFCIILHEALQFLKKEAV